ncbi:hypothetical protein Tco_1119244, partial [Tanacetum coccineum]
LKALIDQGVADALAARDADRSRNGKDNHDSRTGGTERVVELTQWFERMETVFRISNCTTVGHDVAYVMTWTNLKKKMTDKYCLRGEVKKLEGEMWNLKVKESNNIEKYVSGLPDMIHGSVMASKPKIMQDAIEFATEVMDKKIPRPGERKEYAGTLPLCNKCKFHHNGQCIVKALQDQAEGTKACGMVYALGGGETDQDPNNIEDETET